MRVQIWFLKATLLVINMPLLLMSVFWWPRLMVNIAAILPRVVILGGVVGLLLYGMTGLLLWSGFQLIRILNEVAKQGSFGLMTSQALRQIRRAAIWNTVGYMVSLPFFYFVADRTDAPGIMLIGFAIILVSVMIATGTNLLLRLQTHHD
ncbi:DUF2975 domain-containing protein [Latilactobacillus fuchuensis]|uniref:DUF2975 domain-containing protein n=1 Tax=Latilactobacillus fuchuensis TaxID=164393 RepID=UPI00046A8D02|nr:DUF2975 domain-containing protein [Latilactobacillus fuchuensis]